MSSSISSAFATLMMFAALFGLPAIAIFGVPEIKSDMLNSLSKDSADVPVAEVEQRKAAEITMPSSDLFAPIEKSSEKSSSRGRLQSQQSTSSEKDRSEVSQMGDTFFQSARDSVEKTLTDNNQPRSGALVESANTGRAKLSPPAEALEGWEIEAASSDVPYKQIEEKDLPESTTALETTESNSSPFGSYNSAGNTQLAVNKAEQDNARLVSATNPKPKLTWPEVQQRLDALGIRHFQLTPNKNSGKFLFRCMYKNPAPRRMIVRLFEAEAEEPLIAIEDVLQQIETWQKNQL